MLCWTYSVQYLEIFWEVFKKAAATGDSKNNELLPNYLSMSIILIAF